jgi:hypothetical protein
MGQADHRQGLALDLCLLEILQTEGLADQTGHLLEIDQDIGEDIDFVALLDDHVSRFRALHISEDVRRLHDLLNGCVGHGVSGLSENIHGANPL